MSDFQVVKKGKKLKAVPAKLKKDPDIVDLQDRKKDLRKQLSRIRPSLELAMCRCDGFSGEELLELLRL